MVIEFFGGPADGMRKEVPDDVGNRIYIAIPPVIDKMETDPLRPVSLLSSVYYRYDDGQYHYHGEREV